MRGTSPAALVLGAAATLVAPLSGPSAAVAQTASAVAGTDGGLCSFNNETATCDSTAGPYDEGVGVIVTGAGPAGGSLTLDDSTGALVITNTTANGDGVEFQVLDTNNTGPAVLTIDQNVIITGNTGSGVHGVQFTNGHQGETTFTSDGTISAQSGSVINHGVRISTNNNNTGDMTISLGANSSITAQDGDALRAEQSGSGNMIFTNQGTMQANTPTTGNYINYGAFLRGQGPGNMTVTNNGTIRGGGGMRVQENDNGTVTMTNNGTIESLGARAALDIDLNDATRTAAATFTNAAGGTIDGGTGTALFATHEGQGSLRIENAGTLSGMGGISIDGQGSNTTTLVNSGIIDSGTGTGISYSGNASNTVTSITNSGTIQGTGQGISLDLSDAGNATIDHSGIIDVGDQGIRAEVGSNDLANITVNVTSNGTATDEIATSGSNESGIVLGNQGTGDISLTLGAGTRVTTSGTFSEGIESYLIDSATGFGAFTADIAGTVRTTAADAPGMYHSAEDIRAGRTADMGTITIRDGGSIVSDLSDGLQLSSDDGGNGAAGATAVVTIESGGMLSGATNGFVETATTGSPLAIATTLDVGGTLSGGTVAAQLLTGDDTFVLRETATVNGTVDGGAGADLMRFDFGGNGSFNAGLLTTQYVNFETFEKEGAGTLTLTGSDAGTRTLAVNAGTVLNNASVANTTFTVANGATLGGDGTLGGLVINGTLSPGNSIGTLNVAGNAVFAAGSTFAVEIDAAGNADRLVATGDVTIDPNGTTLAVSGPAVIYPTGTQSYTVIEAGGAVSGRFATVTDSIPDIDLAAVYNPGSVELTYTKAAAGGTGGTPVGTPTGTPIGTPSGPTFSDKAAAPSVAGAAATTSALFATTIADGAAALARSGASGAGGAATFSLDRPTDVGAFAADLSLGDAPVAVAPKRGRLEAHAFAFGETASVDSEVGLRGYDVDAGGLGAGLRGAFDAGTGTVALGAAGAVSRTETGTALSAAGASAAEADLYQIGLDGAWSDGRTTVAGALGYGFLDVETARTLQLGGNATATALGETDGHAVSYVADLSHDVAPLLGWAATVAPYARIEGSHVELDGFVETGAGILNLAVAGASADVVTGEIGLRLGTEVALEGGVLRPTAEIAYRHALGDEVVGSASAIAAVGAIFGEAVRVSDESSVGVGAGLAFERGNLAATVDYKGAFGSEVERHQGHLGFAVRF